MGRYEEKSVLMMRGTVCKGDSCGMSGLLGRSLYEL